MTLRNLFFDELTWLLLLVIHTASEIAFTQLVACSYRMSLSLTPWHSKFPELASHSDTAGIQEMYRSSTYTEPFPYNRVMFWHRGIHLQIINISDNARLEKYKIACKKCATISAFKQMPRLNLNNFYITWVLCLPFSFTFISSTNLPTCNPGIEWQYTESKHVFTSLPYFT